MYRVTIEKSMSSAHFLRLYAGKCREMHGHNWIFQVTIEAEVLDETGMVVDFGEVKKHLAEILEPLDHKVINEITPFQQLNPTAENLCAFAFTELKKRWGKNRTRVASVKVWETPSNVAEYSEP